MAPQHYQKIASHIREAINNGELTTGDELPSEAELCEQFGSSRGPVRQAMMLLRTEGMISTGRGRRSTVLARSSGDSFDSAVSVSAWLEGHGRRPGQETLLMARQPASERVADLLRLTPGSHIITLRRLRTADGEPLAIETIHFPVEIGRHILDLDTDNRSVYQHLRERDIIVDNVTRCVSATIADEEQAGLLRITPGEALLQVRLAASDQYGQIISCADHLFRADNLTLSLNTVRGTPSPAYFTPLAGVTVQ